MGKGRRQNKTGRSEGGDRYVQLEYWLLEHPSYLALSAHAKLCMVVMAKRYNGSNNGRIAFGVRSGIYVPINGKDLAEKPFGLNRNQISRSLQELEAAGFIVCTQAATFDQKRLVREWRLTWLPSGAKREVRATKEFATFKKAEIQKPVPPACLSPTLQSRPCDYELDPISPNDLYSLTGVTISRSDSPARVTHLVTMGSGATVIPIRGARTA